ncbi:MAG: nitroreductase family protein [Acidimicrobiales bacterium]
MSELSNLELLTTTRTVRRRLDLTRPVERSDVTACLEVALQAPNASNQQWWAWVVVDDAATRKRMADVYRAGMTERAEQIARMDGTPTGYTVKTREQQIQVSVNHLRDHLHEVPVLVVPTIFGRLDGADIATQASRWGSVIPAVWSFMLALRAKGMGSAWTTTHLLHEAEMAEVLGIPFDQVTQVGLFPVAYTIGTTFRPGVRDASGDAIRWNRW